VEPRDLVSELFTQGSVGRAAGVMLQTELE